ncbi:DUF2784 family protein [Novipirellula sp. SH528]|uniref:DUF2784 family protein n=1 Tax=Novipirellula sp. SH528 TaxID=3454466 RepID=UPI003FA17289
MGVTDIFATTIVTIHIVVIAFDVGGSIAVVTRRLQVTRLRLWQRLYLTIVFVKSLSLLMFDSCPLTSIENWLRRYGHIDTSYGDSFVSHYLIGLSKEVDLVMTCFLMLAGLVAVLRFVASKSPMDDEFERSRFNSISAAAIVDRCVAKHCVIRLLV